MRVLVTGGRGFIGSRLLRELTDHEVLVCDLAAGGDIGKVETAKAIERFAPEIVFHLAALHHVPWCREHPAETMATNAGGFNNVLSSIHHPVAVVLASSAAVYGFGEEPFTEEDPLAPVDVYGQSKGLAEALLRGFTEEHPRARCAAARLFNVVGPDDGTDHVLPTIARAARAGHPVTLGNLWPRRDYVHVDDVVGALMSLAEGAPQGFSSFNVGTGIGTEVRDLAEMFDVQVRVDRSKRRALDGHLVARVEKIWREVGWTARRPLSLAVSQTLGIAA